MKSVPGVVAELSCQLAFKVQGDIMLHCCCCLFQIVSACCTMLHLSPWALLTFALTCWVALSAPSATLQ